MNLFKHVEDSTTNAREQISGTENHDAFMLMITLLSLINKTYYSPVTFLIEYVNSPRTQKFFEEKTGINKYNFIVAYMEEFPTVTTSRKLKANIKNKE